MADNLFDTIKQRIAQPEPVTPQLGQGEAIQALSRAKTGKEAAPGSGPRQSALGEKLAARQAQLGQEQLATTGQLKAAQQTEQQADIAERTRQQAREYEQQRDLQERQLKIQTDNILNEFATGERRLNNRRDLAAMEQVGTALRLENQQYIQNLQQEAQKARLDDSLNFEEALTRDMYQHSEDMMIDESTFNTLIRMDDRAFEQELAKINAAIALELMEKQIKAANTQAMFGAATDLVTGTTQSVLTLPKEDRQQLMDAF